MPRLLLVWPVWEISREPGDITYTVELQLELNRSNRCLPSFPKHLQAYLATAVTRGTQKPVKFTTVLRLQPELALVPEESDDRVETRQWPVDGSGRILAECRHDEARGTFEHSRRKC